MELFARERQEVAPGAVHVPDWLALERQRSLLDAARGWAVDLRHTVMPNGGVMSVRSVCLGWAWEPYRYVPAARPFPDWLGALAREAVAAAYGDAGDYAPDQSIVNYYDAAAKMGLHQDHEERSDAPVVAISLGDTCTFRFGNTETRGRPYTDVELRSGDLFVFGRESRRAFHGVPRVVAGTAPPALGMKAGRLSVTVRESGLGPPPRR